jgi:Tol biopolymer transport system component
VNVRTAAAITGALFLLVGAGAAMPATLAAPAAVAYTDDGGSLYLSNVQGANSTTLFQSDDSTSMQALDFSPDGKQVLAIEYGDDTNLVLVPAAGGNPVTINGTDGATSGAYSPDGSKIVFTVDDSSSDTLSAGIYTVSVSGGTPKLIATTPNNASDALPAYSPDGTKLAFVRDLFDNQGNETTSLEVMPSSGSSSPTALATGLAPDLESGGIAFSPDGTKIAYAGNYDTPGIFTVPVAGGNPTELTSDYDSWPSYSADGSKIYFSRDAISTDADGNASAPVDPVDNDLFELWSVNKDGSGATVIAEGDFENLAVAAIATSGGTTTSTTTTTTTATPTGGAPAPTTKTTPTSTAPVAKSVAKAHPGAAASVHVSTKGSRYIVRWTGKAKSWRVILKVGSKTYAAKVKATVHSHVFLLPHAHGKASAQVKTT